MWNGWRRMEEMEGREEWLTRRLEREEYFPINA